MALATDVTIVGAGPTGLALANLLGGMGVKTTLVERNRSTVEEPRAVSIDDESMRTLQAIGLHEVVEAIVAKGYGSRYLSPSRQCFAVVDPVTRDYGFEKRNGFQQPALEAVLRRGLDRYPNVRQIFGGELIDFHQTADSVFANIRQSDGGVIAITSSYLVGSDGGRSTVRKQLEIPLDGSTFAQAWLIVDLVRTENRFRHTEVFCDPHRPCISLPGPDRIRRYEFMLKPGEDEPQATEEQFVRDLLERVGPDRDMELRRVRVYTFHARIAAQWRRGRVFLAGDAAHLTPPFAGQGMNSGIRDAHNLGWKLAEALAMPDPVALLDSYEAERKPHAWEMIGLALRMGQVMMPASHWQAFLVRTGFRILGLYPPARDYVAQMRYKPKPRFRTGLFWSDGRKERRTLVGRLLPQPTVEAPDRSRYLLDAVLPDMPVVLVFDEYPDRVLSVADRMALEAAGAAVVGLTPEWMNPVAGGFPVVRDVSRLFSAEPPRSYLGSAFLLRRDRYVAAVVAASDAGDLVDKISAIRAPAPAVTVAKAQAYVASA
ncbi:MAG: bifunctional 3-(3-hydroxy-phenyl)propionate/3-hydroxycinnamic acid hydroxylase [Azospirillaceae bacterium]|nr:bifunctional 3-(3-hydroxy-phenyl)propionate/3-hydroxycinnamic acid hydroxylase [Azospirillaceae bacterium]